MAAAAAPVAAEEQPPPPSLWDQVCAEFAAREPAHPDRLDRKEEEHLREQKEEEAPPWTLQARGDVGASPALTEDRSKSATADEAAPQKTPSHLSLPLAPELPDLKTCSPREFLEHYIFPVLLPGIAELLLQAKKEKCFERKRTKFIALDFLTEWLFNQNAKRTDDPFVEFFEIPFVKEWLKDHILKYIEGVATKDKLLETFDSSEVLERPETFLESPRPPIALSLLLSEEEASNIIQSFWRGYRVRCEPEVQELRQWQKHLRETKNIFKRVREFWAKQEKKDSAESFACIYQRLQLPTFPTFLSIGCVNWACVGTKLEDSVQPSPQRSKFSVLEIFRKTEATDVAPEVAAAAATAVVVVEESPSRLSGPSL